MAATLSPASGGGGLPTGPADLQALEDRFERRFAELELRHQRHLDSLQAKRDKDIVTFEEAVSLAKRCELDLEVFSEWRHEVCGQLAAVAAAVPRAEAVAQSAQTTAQGASEEARRCVETAKLSQTAAQERVAAIATEMREKIACIAAAPKELAVRQSGEELDVQELFQRSPWAKSLDKSVLRNIDKVDQAFQRVEKLEKQTSLLQGKLADQHDDVSDLHARWATEAAQRVEVFENCETRLAEFSAEFAGQRTDMKRYIEEQVSSALKEIGTCSAACISLREALDSEMAQLHGERAAMRRAWERVEALRKDETWGYFLKKDEDWNDWRSDISRRIDDIADEVAQCSDTIWPEIGKLGCRVADLHQMVDECLPSKRHGSDASSASSAGRVQPRKLSVHTPLISRGVEPTTEKRIRHLRDDESRAVSSRSLESKVDRMIRNVSDDIPPPSRRETWPRDGSCSEEEHSQRRHTGEAVNVLASGRRRLLGNPQAANSASIDGDIKDEHDSYSCSSTRSAVEALSKRRNTSSPDRSLDEAFRHTRDPERKLSASQHNVRARRCESPECPERSLQLPSGNFPLPRRSFLDDDLSGLLPDTAA